MCTIKHKHELPVTDARRFRRSWRVPLECDPLPQSGPFGGAVFTAALCCGQLLPVATSNRGGTPRSHAAQKRAACDCGLCVRSDSKNRNRDVATWGVARPQEYLSQYARFSLEASQSKVCAVWKLPRHDDQIPLFACLRGVVLSALTR